MAYLSMSAVATAIYSTLNVAGLTALVGSRIYDDIPQAPIYPFVWIETFGEVDRRGFGGGGLPEVSIRVHVFSQHHGTKEAQDIARKVIELLRDQSLTVTGYTQCGTVFFDEAVLFPQEVIQGVKVREVVALFRVYVEEI